MGFSSYLRPCPYSAPLCPLTRVLLKGGGGVLEPKVQKFVYQNLPNQYFLLYNFTFSHYEKSGSEGGGGVRTPPAPRGDAALSSKTHQHSVTSNLGAGVAQPPCMHRAPPSLNTHKRLGRGGHTATPRPQHVKQPPPPSLAQLSGINPPKLQWSGSGKVRLGARRIAPPPPPGEGRHLVTVPPGRARVGGGGVRSGGTVQVERGVGGVRHRPTGKRA